MIYPKHQQLLIPQKQQLQQHKRILQKLQQKLIQLQIKPKLLLHKLQRHKKQNKQKQIQQPQTLKSKNKIFVIRAL